MSRVEQVRQRTKHLGLILALALTCLVLIHYLTAPANGAQLGSRSLFLSTNVASANATYYLTFHTATAGNIGSISFDFCSNSPFPTDPCVAPAGFNSLGTTLSNQVGITGFTIDSSSTANRILLTRASIPAPVTAVEYDFTGITNPSNEGSYFVRIQTYQTIDAAGPASDYGGIAFAIASPLSITATVPPYLTFCAAQSIGGLDCSLASGQYVQLGELSSSGPSSGTSQFYVATNAGVGYTVTVSGPPMSSGINALVSMAVPDISRPGTSQFGINVVQNGAPAVGINPQGPGSGVPNAGYNTPDVYMFNSGDSLVTHSGTDIGRLFTVSYLVNVPPTQPAGIYVTTFTYIALAQF